MTITKVTIPTIAMPMHTHPLPALCIAINIIIIEDRMKLL